MHQVASRRTVRARAVERTRARARAERLDSLWRGVRVGALIVTGAVLLLLAAARWPPWSSSRSSRVRPRPVVDSVRSHAPFGRTAVVGLLFALFGVFVIVIGILVIPAALGQFDELDDPGLKMLASARQAAQDVKPEASRTR